MAYEAECKQNIFIGYADGSAPTCVFCGKKSHLKEQTMAKKLNQLISLDKIEAIWATFLEDKANGKEFDEESLGLNDLEKAILKSVANSFAEEIDNLY